MQAYFDQFNTYLQSLREKQKSVRENHGPSIKQMKMWNVSFMGDVMPRIKVNPKVIQQFSIVLL